MNLLQHITSSIHSAAASAGSWWHDHASPWLTLFLHNTAKAEVDALVPIARSYVQQAVPALVSAIASGNTQAFADAQWDVIVATGDAAKKALITVAVTSVSTAVNAAIVGHPDVAAAIAGPDAAAPQAAASP